MCECMCVCFGGTLELARLKEHAFGEPQNKKKKNKKGSSKRGEKKGYKVIQTAFAFSV